MLDDYRWITRLQVRFNEIDMMQHVNHTAYIRWAEAVRADYFDAVIGEPANGEHGMILVKATFSYERQLRIRERVAIGTRISRIGGSSFDFSFDIVSEDAQARSVFGTTTMVAYDYHHRTRIAVPERWRERIRGYEKLPPHEEALPS